MLSALGLISQSERESDAIVARVLRLGSDPRGGWAETIEELLATLPPETPLRCKDKRVLDVMFSLAEAQLLPYPGPVRDVSNLLRATTRIIECARGLYALLPKFSLDFLFRSASGLLRGEPDTARLLAEMLAVCIAIVNLCGASGAEDDKLERAARSHFHAEGGTASVFELLAASTVYEVSETRLRSATAGAIASRSALASAAAAATNNPFDGLTDVVPLLALRVLEALLLVRPANTEYAIVVAAVEHAVRFAPALLRLTDHGNERVRRAACSVLHAVLLECDPAQCSILQNGATESAALLPLLACCFAGGEQIVRTAVPRPLHLAADADAHDDDDADADADARDDDDDDADADARDDDDDDARDDADAALPISPVTPTPLVSLVAASLDSVAVHVAFAHRPSRRCPSRPSTTPLGTALDSHGARHGASTAARTALGTALPTAAASAPALGTALGTEDVAIYRKVVALLCDDSEVALSLLARIAPRALVSRYLRRPRVASGAPDAATVLAALEPAERARVRALSRADLQRYCRATRHDPQLPRGRWPLFWKAMQSNHDEPLLLWRAGWLGTLQAACAQEIADVRLEAALSTEPLERLPFFWEHRTFEVTYPQLASALYVAPLYIEPLLEALRPHVSSAGTLPTTAPPTPSPGARTPTTAPSAEPPVAPTTAPPLPTTALPKLPIAPAVMLERLWQRASIEPSAERQLMLLEALGLVLALYGGAEPALSCMPYLVSLLRPETAPPPASSKGHQPVPPGPAAKARPRDEVKVSSGAPAQVSSGAPVQVSSGAPAQVSSGAPAQVSSGASAQVSSGAPAQVSSGAPKARLPKAALVHGLEPRVRMAL